MLKVTDTTLAYIAGLIDGEAYIGIKRTAAYRSQGRRSPGFHARIQIRMVHEGAIKLLSETFGGWYFKEKRPRQNRRQLFCFQASDAAAEEILKAVLPFLVVKRPNAELVLEYRQLQAESGSHKTKILGHRNFPNKYGTPRQVPNLGLSDEYVARCTELWSRAKELNH